jgi:hypothetical protein
MISLYSRINFFLRSRKSFLNDHCNKLALSRCFNRWSPSVVICFKKLISNHLHISSDRHYLILLSCSSCPRMYRDVFSASFCQCQSPYSIIFLSIATFLKFFGRSRVLLSSQNSLLNAPEILLTFKCASLHDNNYLQPQAHPINS